MTQPWPVDTWTWVKAGLDGPSIPVRVEPLRLPQTEPREAPTPAQIPVKPEKVPA